VNWQAPAHCKGLVFDCDGTVVDNMPLHYEAWSKTLERCGLHLEESRFYSWAGRPIADIIGQLSAEQRVSVDTQQVTQEYEHYFHSLPLHRLRPVRPVVEIARRFRGQLPMAIATGSTTESASTSLQAIGVLHWFDAVISSTESGMAKPAPDVFLAAARSIGVPARACVAFEDGDLGLKAARAAGMTAVDIRPWNPRPQ